MAYSHHCFRIPRMPVLLRSRQHQRPPTVCQNSPSISTASSTHVPAPIPPPPSSAYVHLPFCRKRCHYCDFPIFALGTSGSSSNAQPASNYSDDPRIANYISLVVREIEATRAGSVDDPPLETVFFGGGTPSLVPPSLVATILDALRSRFGMREDVEMSMEMDPGTFDAVKLDELLGLGVNRVSLGVQAFQEQLLKACGRAHGLQEVHEAIEMVAGASKLANWSMDIISSLPYQTLQMWEETLRLAIDAQPSHVSVYDLQVEQGTKFGHLYTPGEFPLPTESQSADFYKMAARMLAEAGFDHYEISNYCKPGFECKHNLVYWNSRSFHGFGLGAASYINGRRFSRPRRMKEYAAYVKMLEDGLVKEDGTVAPVDARDMAMDVVMLSLRTARGLDTRSFAEMFGQPMLWSLCSTLEPFLDSGHVVALDGRRRASSTFQFEGNSPESTLAFIRLSDPDGFLLSNELISKTFAAMSLVS